MEIEDLVRELADRGLRGEDDVRQRLGGGGRAEMMWGMPCG